MDTAGGKGVDGGGVTWSAGSWKSGAEAAAAIGRDGGKGGGNAVRGADGRKAAAMDPDGRADTAAMDAELRAAMDTDGRAGGVATSSTSESPVRDAGGGFGSTTELASLPASASCACAARALRIPDKSRWSESQCSGDAPMISRSSVASSGAEYSKW